MKERRVAVVFISWGLTTFDLIFVSINSANGSASGGALAKPKHHLPEKYADEKTSSLTVNVKKGKNVFDFDLKK